MKHLGYITYKYLVVLTLEDLLQDMRGRIWDHRLQRIDNMFDYLDNIIADEEDKSCGIRTSHWNQALLKLGLSSYKKFNPLPTNLFLLLFIYYLLF